LLLIEFEILVSDISGNSETLIEIIVDQLSDPNSVLLSGVIGSNISTEFGLFYVSDDGTVSGNEQLIFTSYIASTTSTSAADFSVTVASALVPTTEASKTTTVAAATTTTGHSNAEEATYNGPVETVANDAASTSAEATKATKTMHDSKSTQTFTKTSTEEEDDFIENIVAVNEPSSAAGVIIAVIIVAVVLVIVFVSIIVITLRRRAQLGPKKAYTVNSNDIEKNMDESC
jgi:hypothetical protein